MTVAPPSASRLMLQLDPLVERGRVRHRPLHERERAASTSAISSSAADRQCFIAVVKSSTRQRRRDVDERVLVASQQEVAPARRRGEDLRVRRREVAGGERLPDPLVPTGQPRGPHDLVGARFEIGVEAASHDAALSAPSATHALSASHVADRPHPLARRAARTLRRSRAPQPRGPDHSSRNGPRPRAARCPGGSDRSPARRPMAGRRSQRGPGTCVRSYRPRRGLARVCPDFRNQRSAHRPCVRSALRRRGSGVGLGVAGEHPVGGVDAVDALDRPEDRLEVAGVGELEVEAELGHPVGRRLRRARRGCSRGARTSTSATSRSSFERSSASTSTDTT